MLNLEFKVPSEDSSDHKWGKLFALVMSIERVRVSLLVTQKFASSSSPDLSLLVLRLIGDTIELEDDMHAARGILKDVPQPFDEKIKALGKSPESNFRKLRNQWSHHSDVQAMFNQLSGRCFPYSDIDENSTVEDSRHLFVSECLSRELGLDSATTARQRLNEVFERIRDVFRCARSVECAVVRHLTAEGKAI